MLILEGAQAGLSWLTILRKRENYRKAFENFDAQRVARFTPARIEKLMGNPGIVRDRAKIQASVANAKAVLKIRDEFGSLDAFLWAFVGGKTVDDALRRYADAPARSSASEAMSKALIQRGCKFVGPTILYAFMQAVGMVNDHEVDCAFRKPRRPRS